jgi:hypothetical protein
MQPAQFGGCITAQAISAELSIKFVQRISQPQGFGLFHSFSAHRSLSLNMASAIM